MVQEAGLRVRRLEEVDTEMVTMLGELLSVLTESPNRKVDFERVAAMVAAPDTEIFVVDDNSGNVLGMLTLVRYRTLQKDKFWIEDVVALPSARGRGVGRMLVEEAVAYARGCSAEATVWLTSRASRTAARALYRSVGFEEYPTTVFKL